MTHHRRFEQVARAITFDPDNFRLLIDEKPLGYVLGGQPKIELLIGDSGVGIAWIPIFIMGGAPIEDDDEDRELDCS